jgi:hypothetical protein
MPLVPVNAVNPQRSSAVQTVRQSADAARRAITNLETIAEEGARGSSNVSGSDVNQIGAMISSYMGGDFDASQLVNYGKTVILKPGARMSDGRLIKGMDVSKALSGSFNVHPMAVSYGVENDQDNESAFEKEMESLLSDAEADADVASDSEPSTPSFGALSPPRMTRRAVRLRRRYERISRRFGKFTSKAVARGRRRAKRVAARVFKRIQKLWSKMKRKGIPTQGLLSPDALKAKIQSAAEAIQSGASAESAFDQAALERSVGTNLTTRLLQQQIANSAFGSEGSLLADVRAETLGFLYGGAEHDYFGIVGERFNVIIGQDDEDSALDDAEIDAEIDELLSDDDLSDTDFLDGDEDLSDEDLEAQIDAELEQEGGDTSSSAVASAVSSTIKSVASDVDAILKEIAQTVPVATNETQARRISRARTRLNELVRRGGGADQLAQSTVEISERLQVLKDKLTELDSALQNSSERGSVNYAALAPASKDDDDKIVVIAVNKKASGSANATAEGYTAAQAYQMLTGNTHPSDYRGENPLDVYTSMLDGYNAEAQELFGVVYGRPPAPRRRPAPPPARRRPVPPPARRRPVPPPARRRRAPAPPPGLLFRRYRALVMEYRRAVAARNQRLAAQILGRLRALWASLTAPDRRRVPPPARFRLPGLRLALRNPAVREIDDDIEAEIDSILDEDDGFGRVPRPVAPRRIKQMLRRRGGKPFPRGPKPPFPPPRMAGKEVF